MRRETITPAQLAVLTTNLANFNVYRGSDSWGRVGIEDNGHVNVKRGLGPLSDQAFELCNFYTLFAHTRAATNGDVVVKNAHPFRIGKIIGAHNGMIYNYLDLNQAYDRDFEVDSMHIFAHLNEKKHLDELIGYGAIEWIHQANTRRINLCKLLGGELSIYGIGDPKKTDGIVWSSSFRHLQKALHSAGIRDYFRYEVRRDKVYQVFNGELFNTGRRLSLAAPEQENENTDNHQESTEDKSENLLRFMRPGASDHRDLIDDYRLFNKIYGQRSEA